MSGCYARVVTHTSEMLEAKSFNNISNISKGDVRNVRKKLPSILQIRKGDVGSVTEKNNL
jgi:hypothetical protein